MAAEAGRMAAWAASRQQATNQQQQKQHHCVVACNTNAGKNNRRICKTPQRGANKLKSRTIVGISVLPLTGNTCT